MRRWRIPKTITHALATLACAIGLVLATAGIAGAGPSSRAQPAPSGTLTLLVTVDNAGAASATPTDFGVEATGPATVQGTSGASGTVPAGTYTLQAPTVSNPSAAGSIYDYGSWVWTCTGNSGPFTPGPAASSVAIGAGESVTCTVALKRQFPTLALSIGVVNSPGSTATASAFTITLTGPVTRTGRGSFTGVVPEGAYTVSVSGPPGYLTVWTSCTVFFSLAGHTAYVPVATPGQIGVGQATATSCAITETPTETPAIGPPPGSEKGLAPEAAAPARPTAVNQLAFAGANLWAEALVALGLLAVGALLVKAGRRRSHAERNAS